MKLLRKLSLALVECRWIHSFSHAADRDDRDDHEVFARAGACVGSETLEGGIMARRLIRNLDS